MTNNPANPDRPDALPPIGVQPGTPQAADLIALVNARRNAINNALAAPRRLAASCRKMVVWGEDDVEFPDDCTVVVNKTQQVCFTQAANHLKDPVKATIVPVQKGEYSRWYWCGPEDEAMQVQIPEAAVDEAGQQVVDAATGQPATMLKPLDMIYVGGTNPTTGEPIPPEPLPRAMVKQLQQMAQQDEIDPQWICQLNDEYTAKTMQTVFDEDWRLAKVDKWAWRTVWSNIVEGWQLPLYEYDAKTGRHMLGRNSIDQTYIDQSCEDIDDAAEAGIDLYMDMDEALAKYPDQREAILKEAGQGNVTPAPMSGTVPESYRGQFERPLVRKVVWWMRNQPVKMSEKEALDGGDVVQLQAEHQPVFQQDGAPEPADGAGGDAPPIAAGDEGQDGGPPQQPIPAGDLGDAQATPPPVGYTLPDGTPVTPADPRWPTRLGIREISIIADAPAGPDWDRECPHDDIPLLHLKNIFVIGKPWGVGEPFAVRNLNKAHSRITNSAVEHTRYNARSAMEMKASLKDALEKEYGEAFINPAMIIGVPDSMWGDQPSVRAIEGSKLSADSYRIREMLSEDINEIGGRPDVSSGTTPTKNASGQLVAQLSDNAAAPLNFKAQQIQHMFEKVAARFLSSILKFKPLEEMAAIAGVPVPLMAMVRDRARSRVPNVSVTISTGAGSAIERKRANYAQWNQMVSPDDGLPLADGKTTRELLGIDPDVSVRRSLTAKKEAAAAMGGQQKPPSESISFKDLPISGKVQMGQQAGLQLDPGELQAADDQQRADKQAEMQAKMKQGGGPPNGGGGE